ncbi:MAG: amino acid ABC transporter substrate-binding protein [Moraxellaceae bacterium]|nr:amino acid ABC transporter substrate-binding protein [Moraxellaceae bacterium]
MTFSFNLKNLLQASVLPLALTLSLTACQPADTSTDSLNSYEQLKQNKVVHIGTEGTYAPFSYHDTAKDNSLTGFDVELAREVFKRAGIEKVEFVEAPWDSLIAGLDAGRYEVVANQIGINAERQKKYDFSNPYISSPLVVITRDDNTDIKTLEDIKGKKSAQTATSNYGQTAIEKGAIIVTSDGFAQSIDLLTTGRADVTLNDRLSFLDYKKQKPDAKIKIAVTNPKSAESGFLLKKDSPELAEAINKALDEIKADGTYAKISTEFFGTDVSKPE